MLARLLVVAALGAALLVGASPGRSASGPGRFSVKEPAPGQLTVVVVQARVGAAAANGRLPLPVLVAPRRLPHSVVAVAGVGRVSGRKDTIYAAVVLVNAGSTARRPADFNVAVGLSWKPLKYTQPVGSGSTSCKIGSSSLLCEEQGGLGGLHGFQTVSVDVYLENPAVAEAIIASWGFRPGPQALVAGGEQIAAAAATTSAGPGGARTLPSSALPADAKALAAGLNRALSGSLVIDVGVPLTPTSSFPAAETFEEKVEAPDSLKVESVVDDLQVNGHKGFTHILSVDEPGPSQLLFVKGVIELDAKEPLPRTDTVELKVSGPPDAAPLEGAVSTKLLPASTACSALGTGMTLWAGRLDGTKLAASSLQQACRQSFAATSAPAPRYSCNGQIVKVFDNFSGVAVKDGATPPSFTTSGAFCVTSVATYHWHGGKGDAPGTVGLSRVSGPSGFPATAGPFAAVGSAGQNGAPDVNWQANVPTSPTPVVISGTYRCTDSKPATWSSASASGPGFCRVYGIPATPR